MRTAVSLSAWICTSATRNMPGLFLAERCRINILGLPERPHSKVNGYFAVTAKRQTNGSSTIIVGRRDFNLSPAETRQLRMRGRRTQAAVLLETGWPVAFNPVDQLFVSRAVPLCLVRDQQWQIRFVGAHNCVVERQEGEVLIVEGRETRVEQGQRQWEVYIGSECLKLPRAPRRHRARQRISLVIGANGQILTWTMKARFSKADRKRINALLA